MEIKDCMGVQEGNNGGTGRMNPSHDRGSEYINSIINVIILKVVIYAMKCCDCQNA